MKFGLNWLAEWVAPLPSAEQLTQELPRCGFEVVALAAAGENFSGVTIAEVLGVEQHPNADKLRVCEVYDGVATRQIVCGAPNARAGIKVAMAAPGAILPGDFAIKATTIRGVESNGMLCSERELGLGADHDGIIELPQDTSVGQSFRKLSGLDDKVIELEITPNRGDCLSLLGMAREVSTIFDLPLTQPAVVEPESRLHKQPGIKLEAPQACPAYFARVARLPGVPGAAPDWMRQRLANAGLRPINLWVDITNYVMLELGQPLHAFDNSRLNGDISVRFAKEGDIFTLLNEQQIVLKSHHLMICDANGPVALGGVMGGKNSAVTEHTTEVLLEAAHFSPDAVAGRARELKLASDASFRFERGVDPTLPPRALTRACKLLVELAGAELGPECSAVDSAHMPATTAIEVDYLRLNRLAGVTLPRDFVCNKLQALGFNLQGDGSDIWQVTPPSHRLDVEQEQDVLEEVLRFYGLTNLPDSLPVIQPTLDFVPEAQPPQTRVEDHLVALGYQEVISYSFISAEESQNFSTCEPIALVNPIAETQAVMRPTLMPSLLAVLDYNRRRQQYDLKLFETGLVYHRVEGVIAQHKMLGMAAFGTSYQLHWRDKPAQGDFYTLKGDLESLLALFGLAGSVDFVPLFDHPGLHSKRCAAITRDGEVIGVAGELAPQMCRVYDFSEQRPVLAELRLDKLLQKPLVNYTGISRYPGASRDFAFVLKDGFNYADIEKAIVQAAGPLLRQVLPFDLFTGKGSLPQGHSSLAVRLHWVSSKSTMSDRQINHFVSKVVEAMQQQFQAELR